MHTCVHPHRPGVSDPLELELFAVVSCLIWVLGPRVWSFARAV